MAMMLLSLISLLLLLGTVIFLILKKFNIFTALSLFYTAAFCLSLKYRIVYKINNMPGPSEQVPTFIYFPIVIAIVILCLAFLCLFINRLAPRSPNRPSRFRWLWFIGGVVILFIGETLAIAVLGTPFAPNLFKSGPLPGWACLISFSFVTVVSIILYRVSQMNSEKSPNLMRYMVFLFAVEMIIATEANSLMLFGKLYGPKIFYPFWGAVITIGFLPTSLLILGIAKDHFPLLPKTSEK